MYAMQVYVVSSYFAIVRQMLSDFFPLAIAFAAETMVSVRRLEVRSMFTFFEVKTIQIKLF